MGVLFWIAQTVVVAGAFTAGWMMGAVDQAERVREVAIRAVALASLLSGK